MGERWLDRKQAMNALDCGHNKLRQLHLNDVLTYKYEGDRPNYDVFSIRNYLAAQKIGSKETDKRILVARFTK